MSLTWQYKDIKASLVQMELEAGTQDDEALQVQHTSSCPLTCRAGGFVYAGQKPQWLDLDGVSWWMLVGRWSRGFNDCDQGCRFVILAALGAQSPLYARQRRQAFLSYRSLFHLTYVRVVLITPSCWFKLVPVVFVFLLVYHLRKHLSFLKSE